MRIVSTYDVCYLISGVFGEVPPVLHEGQVMRRDLDGRRVNFPSDSQSRFPNQLVDGQDPCANAIEDREHYHLLPVGGQLGCQR